MNLKPVVFSALLLLIVFLMYNTVGVGITTLSFAIFFLALAIIFTLKTEYHDKYLNFMNPGAFNVYSEKGSEFIRKKRRMNIICYYILAVIMGFNAFMQIGLMNKIDTGPFFSFRESLPFALVLLGLIYLLNYTSILVMKKSKTANEDLVWNIIIGVVFAIILISFVSAYALRLIL